jgi:processive 1,2-diacylglycerol beta-glucosyltransferase
MNAEPAKPNARILILTLSHGGSHQRASQALKRALLDIRPNLVVEIVDALALCASWFRAYYNSYAIPVRYWPGLWSWIENRQHTSESTGPTWLYRKGAKPLLKFVEDFNPEVVVATEVGVSEWAALAKREAHARFLLVGLVLMDFNRAWVQPEVDFYPSVPGDLALDLETAGVPPSKILPCGLPIDPVFASLPDRATVRARLEAAADVPIILVLFGAQGHGRPRHILSELKKVEQPLQAIFVAGKNSRLEAQLRRLCQDRANFRALGWVDNMPEWMVAADLLVTKPGGSTLAEACACGLPVLAYDPLPGNERRTAARIDHWGIGRWIRKREDLAPTIERLLTYPEELQQLRRGALAQARPRAAHEAAVAILKLLAEHSTPTAS